MYFIHIPGKTNVADVLTKYLPWCDLIEKLGPVLFWKGDTIDSPPPRLRGVTDGKPPGHVAKSSYVERSLRR